MLSLIEEQEEENNFPHNKMLRKDILRGKKLFNSIYKKGKSFGEKYVVVFCKKNNLDYSRFAFLASKKVGNSVKRHRATRLMKEAFRLMEYKVKDGFDIIFIARNTILDVKCIDVRKSMERVLKRTGVIEK